MYGVPSAECGIINMYLCFFLLVSLTGFFLEAVWIMECGVMWILEEDVGGEKMRGREGRGKHREEKRKGRIEKRREERKGKGRKEKKKRRRFVSFMIFFKRVKMKLN